MAAVCRAIDAVLEAEGYGEYCRPPHIRRRGHGLGFGSIRPGDVSLDNDTVLQEGMVFMIHPNQHLPETGYLLCGEPVLLTAQGAEPLTRRQSAGRAWLIGTPPCRRCNRRCWWARPTGMPGACRRTSSSRASLGLAALPIRRRRDRLRRPRPSRRARLSDQLHAQARAALALIRAQARRSSMVGGGVNMLPAAKPLTWIDDIRPLRNVGTAVAEWAGQQRGNGPRC